MCLGKRVGYVGQMCLLYFFCFDHLQGQKKNENCFGSELLGGEIWNEMLS